MPALQMSEGCRKALSARSTISTAVERLAKRRCACVRNLEFKRVDRRHCAKRCNTRLDPLDRWHFDDLTHGRPLSSKAIGNPLAPDLHGWRFISRTTADRAPISLCRESAKVAGDPTRQEEKRLCRWRQLVLFFRQGLPCRLFEAGRRKRHSVFTLPLKRW